MKNEIIPALWNYDNLDVAVKANANNVFILGASINDIEEPIERLAQYEKQVWIDLDMLKGINSDYEGIKFLKDVGYNGIISVKSSNITVAKSLNLTTIQRFFALDSMSLKNGLQNIKRSKPDYIEVLPGMILCDIINEFKLSVNVPVIAAGLIHTRRDIDKLFKIGVSAVSTSDVTLW